jgi:hypothetical protein
VKIITHEPGLCLSLFWDDPRAVNDVLFCFLLLCSSAVLKLAILSQPSECWDYRNASLHLAQIFVYSVHFQIIEEKVRSTVQRRKRWRKERKEGGRGQKERKQREEVREGGEK